MVKAFDNLFLDCAVQPLGLTVRVRVVRHIAAAICCSPRRSCRSVSDVSKRCYGCEAACKLDAIVGHGRVDPTGPAVRRCFRNYHTVRRAALLASWTITNLLVPSMPTNRYSLSSVICIDNIHVKAADRLVLEALCFGLSPSISGRWDMACPRKQHCGVDRVKFGINGCIA